MPIKPPPMNGEGRGDIAGNDGVGGDADKEVKDAKPTFAFFAGRVDVFLYDGILAVTQFDPSVVDAVIADSDPGCGRSVTRATGTLSTNDRGTLSEEDHGETTPKSMIGGVTLRERQK